MLKLRRFNWIVDLGQGAEFVVDSCESDERRLRRKTRLDVSMLSRPVGEAHHLKHPLPDLRLRRLAGPDPKRDELI